MLGVMLVIMPYADLDEALRRYLALCEFRREGLNTLIDSPFITTEARVDAILERDVVLIEWAEAMTELVDLGLVPPSLPDHSRV